jgi:hypothetical protein
MKEYSKINTIFKRDMTKKGSPIIIGDYSAPEFEYLKDNVWLFDEKIDGTNIRIMWDGNNLSIGGKTDNAQIPVGIISYFQDAILPLKDRFATIFAEKPVCIYGEGYGEKIQAGGKYRKGNSVVFFDVKIGDLWLTRVAVSEIILSLGLELVPTAGIGTLKDAINIVSGGFTSYYGDFVAEGIVARTEVGLRNRNGSRIITKIKHRDFFLGEKK